jgi:glycosyltransferase involved in cell wall biosynthesis
VQNQDRLRLAFLADPNSVHTRRWLSWFAERGHDVHLLDGYQTVVAPGLHDRIAVHRYSAHGRWRIPFLSSLQGRVSLRRALKRLRPQVLHAHYLSRYGWQARLSGFHPYVASPWGSDLFVTPHTSRRARWWARAVLRGADLVTVVSEPMRAAVIEAGARRDRIESIQFGVDTQRFAPGPPDDGLAERLGLGSRRVIFSSRAMRPIYRQETVVGAFAKLPADTVLVLTARNADAGYLHAVRSQIDRRGLADRVRILDEISDADLPSLLRLAAVVVSVPASDGFPVSVLEAMASGTPVVATDLPPIRPVLGPIAPELLVPVGDVEAVAAGMRTALAMEPARRERLAAALREYAVRVADYATNMARMETHYRRLASGR